MMKLTSNDYFWLTLTLYYEARGESREGQKAVVKVILNRALARDRSIKEVVLSRKQFSCYNKGLNHHLLIIDDIIELEEISNTCQEGFEEWLSGDDLKGSTHYFSVSGMVGHKDPYWAKSMTVVCEIGRHKFLREA